VRITAVDVFGDAADGRVAAGAPFTVRLRLEAAPGAPSPSLGVEVHALDGALIARAESPGDAAAPAPQGDASAEVRFTQNALLPGAYVLTVFARDPKGHRDFDVHEKAHRFAVWGERSGGGRGLVCLGPRWR